MVMDAVDPGQLDDRALVERMQQGDQTAFAELYERYFDQVYDFLARMLRNRTEAEDVAQDTFIRAVTSIESLRNAASFKSWIFTIARNTALNRIEQSRRARPLVLQDESGEPIELNLIDPDRLGSPEDAARAEETAALVWEAAAGLSAKQYSLLDLHLRQGLASAEIAEVLGVSRNNAYVMVNRLKNAVEESIGAYIMIRQGRRACADLDATLTEANISGISPEARRLVKAHVDGCTTCQQTQADLVSPTAILGAFTPVPAAPGIREAILGDAMRAWTETHGMPDRQQSDPQFHSQPTRQIAVPAGAINISWMAGGLGLLLVGLAMLGVAIANPFAASAGPTTDGPGGAVLQFENDNGTPAAGVSLRIRYEPADGGEPVEFERTTAGSGAIDLAENGPGRYAVTITGLPPELQAISPTQIAEFEVDAGERYELTGIFRLGE